jgi:alpha-tubulin suppressor-like RCC1 family protein
MHDSTTALSSPSEDVIYWDVNANTMPGSQVGGLSGIVAIASSTRLDVDFGLDYGVALKSDGTVWSWDEMVAGSQIDNADAVQISGLSNISSISTGFGNSLALDYSGNVWSWGNNDFGQFGIGITGGGDQPQGITTVPGTTTPNRIPQPVQVTGLDNVKVVSSGLQHCLALKTDGTVWAWGDNEWGQLGDSTTTNRYLPTQVKNLEGIIAISAGDYHSLALKSDGTVWAWGDNESGELGDGTTTDSYVPVQVKGLNHIITIAAGEAQSLALKSDGTVWSWGNNENGQAGNGTQNSTANPGVLTPVQVPNLKNVVAIAEGRMPGGGPYWDGGTIKYGEGYCMVLKSDGTVWDWGEVSYPTETSFKTKPVQVMGLSGVKAIAAGDNYAIAILTNSPIADTTPETPVSSPSN